MPNRTHVFVDGQNLFYGIKEAFGFEFPNYDVLKLSKAICDTRGWALQKIHFYTGVPSHTDNPFWHQFWTKKLDFMGSRGIEVFRRELRYRPKTFVLDDGTIHTAMVGEEKGIDIRIALDIMKLALNNIFDICLIFSQDQDLIEVVNELKFIAKTQKRFIKAASAFPYAATRENNRGINGTDWIRIDKETYNSCIDTYDYRPEQPNLFEKL